MRRRVLTTLGLGLTALLTSLALPPSGAVALDDDWRSFLPANALVPFQLQDIRAATYTYHEPEAATAAGYAPVTECVPNMGHHYGKSIADGQDDLVAGEPNLLVYAPLTGGGQELVAVEYASRTPATLFGRAFDPPRDGVPYYTLHVWVWKVNPEGLFHATNPRVRCEN
ncbi:hypothetical protein [Streptomyces sp. URMC 129]|uniref:hypothetical protein n=1 Tax=Streptomyces sp. URMC 129 TaxID=3423407 RepID=UPI003F195276